MAEYIEPYALILKSHATSATLAPLYNALPKGSNTVSITWDGPEKLNIFTAPEQSAVTRKNIAEIPAGTGRRSVMLSNIGVDDGETVLIGAYSPTVSVGRRATVVVVNLPLKTGGGGVGFLSLLTSWWIGGRHDHLPDRADSRTPRKSFGSLHPRTPETGNRKSVGSHPGRGWSAFDPDDMGWALRGHHGAGEGSSQHLDSPIPASTSSTRWSGKYDSPNLQNLFGCETGAAPIPDTWLSDCGDRGEVFFGGCRDHAGRSHTLAAGGVK